MSDWSARAEIGRSPIPGDNPAGRALTDDPDLDALRQEVKRDPVLGPAPDWQRVSELGTRILSAKSKDFTVAGYHAVALAHTDGLAGLRDGLRVVLGLSESYWESAYPPVPERIRARLNALDWLAEKCTAVVSALEPDPKMRELLGECAQTCADLEKAAEERFEGREITLGTLARSRRELAERLPADGPTPSAAASQPRPAGPVAAPATAGAVRASEVEVAARSDVPMLLLKCASFLRKKDPQDPLGYRLPRIARWAEIDSAPPDNGGKIPLAGPAREQVAALRGLAQKQDWRALLEEVEESFWAAPLWLDLQRFAYEALEGLGAGYRSAAFSVRDELRSLLERAPSLPRLSWNDGSPLADAETQRFVEEQVRTGGGSGAAAAGGAVRAEASGPDAEALEQARTEARAFAKRGDMPAALARVEDALASQSSPRGRFLARLELAMLCADNGRDRLALPILEGLDTQVESHGLDTWEPELATRVLELAYRCQQRLAQDRDAPAEARSRADHLFRRLCRVNPVAAARIE